MLINSLDLVFLALFWGSFYLKYENKFFDALFKFIGVIFATFVTLHYYPLLAILFERDVKITGDFSFVLAYCLLATFIMVLFNFVKDGWNAILAIEVSESVDRVAGLIFHLLRIFFLLGLIFTGCLVSQKPAILKTAQKSFSNKIFHYVSYDVYRKMYAVFIKPVFSKEHMNPDLIKVLASGQPVK